MQKKQMVISPRSIQRDTSVNTFPPDAAYDMLNLRLNTLGENTTYSLTNELGNSAVTVLDNILNIQKGEHYTILGNQVINNIVVLFINKYKDSGTFDNPDYIIKTDLLSEKNTKVLYNGNLGFSRKNPDGNYYPIESIGVYENENIQKIYWIDGIHQPRMINIKKDYFKIVDGVTIYTNPSVFDFNPELDIKKSLQFKVDVIEDSNGNFPAGVIQYAISYFNRNGQQTGAIYHSPLYYTSDDGRGLSPDGIKKSSQAFRLTLENLDTSFEYVRVYRIMRTSLNAVPNVEYIGEYKTNTHAQVQKISNTTTPSGGSLRVAYGGIGMINSGRLSKSFIIDESKYCIEYLREIILVNPDPDFSDPYKKDMVLQDGTYIYTIPKDKICQFKWKNNISRDNLAEPYEVSIVKKVGNEYIESNEVIPRSPDGPTIVQLVDTNTTGTTVDPKELLLLGGDVIKPKTITQKDNTLFLGNYTTEDYHLDSKVKKDIKENSIVSYEYQEVNDYDSQDTLTEQWIHNSNLLRGSNEITFFQKGEVYRVGVQLLHKQGGWSEAIWLGDFENDKRVISNRYNDGIKRKPILKISVPVNKIPTGFIAVRPICVYPSINDRNVLCQGILCPTVYNIKDRNDNSPYVQSSWFARPRPLFRKWNTLEDRTNINKRKGGVLDSYMIKFKYDFPNTYTNTEALYLSSSDSISGEIYGSSSPSDFDIMKVPESERVDKFKNIYGIDERIVTMHSPELDQSYSDELYNISLDGVKFRIVGISTVKDTMSDILINSKSPFTTELSKAYNTNIEDLSGSTYLSNKSMINFPFWVDGVAVKTNEVNPPLIKEVKGAAGFPIYPWHRKGSLSNQGKTENTEGRKSVLNSKIMSNLRVCLPTLYLENSNIKTPYEMPISNIALFSEDQIVNKEIEAWGNKIIYRGNIDKILACEGDNKYDEMEISVPNSGVYHNYIDNINIQDLQSIPSEKNTYTKISSSNGLSNLGILDINKFNNDPISIQYKSTNHAVFAFNKDSLGRNIILPVINNGIFSGVNESFDYELGSNTSSLLWLSKDERRDFTGVSQHSFEIRNDEILNSTIYNDSLQDPSALGTKSPSSFLLGEFYRDNVLNRFGGTSEQALSNNVWTICGEAKYLTEENTKNRDLTTIDLIGDQGDTYYERYDHLKTYPFAPENTNSIVDIVSFMCETRINIDGRYDKNRGKKNNLAVSPINFNLFNKVYSQKNNFFTYNYLRDDDIYNTNFPNQIVWSRTKALGEHVDSWTNIKTINSLDLDGDKGELQSLNRFNNEIYAFQDDGISRVLFNSRAAIPVSDGIPIEIANGGKVEGKIYLNDKYGCQNKWSIKETPSGIYFADNKTNGLYLFNGSNISNISDSRGMYSWAKENITSNKWSPLDYNNIRTLYDNTTGDVYFTTKDKALAFNEKMQAFTSFYSYGGVDWLINLNDEAYQISNFDFNTYTSRDTKIWKMHDSKADRCKFFNISNPYYLQLVANPEFQSDKIIDTIEFRTDDITEVNYSKADYYPFQTIEVSNEYQNGKGNTSTLKKKFRTWRWQLPRSGRDRIRNPWAYIKMICDKDNSVNSLSLYDMVVTYYLP